MLTEFALRNLKPRTAPYKIADRDGMYVAVFPAGTISFRYDYRINGRREALTIGRYGRGDISLVLAREKLLDARRAVREGRSPAVEKQRGKQRRALAKTFGEWAASWPRIKARRSHNVYLSRQSIATMVALHTCAAGSRYVLPSRYAADRCVSNATLNRGMQMVAERAKTAGLPLEPFTVHDCLKRTGSTLLREAGVNCDWIEKSLAHGRDGRYSRAVYNKSQYAVQRWVDMVDAWVHGGGYRLNLLPSDMGISPRGLPLDSQRPS
ncbi:tyrosine-type recombinase/integrase [Burkholderia metallica]|uniref:tyrosine-type recombinase/integrase n=1 Tax=Burkholderia metallica TaxID=488729 RepID=UPI00097152C4|nr:integrase family protein [Burkholderia metallica]